MMTNAETAAQIRRWVDEPHGPFSWPLDRDYEQHMQFVQHRNTHWQGGTAAAWRAFFLAYAEHLETENTESKERCMPRTVFLHQLDEMTSQGCSNPLCSHDHSDGLFLVPLCHHGVGVRVEVLDAPPGVPCAAVAHLRCRRCHASIVRVALTTRLELTPGCRHGRALDVLYQEGRLTVSCRRCDAVQGSVAVAPYVPNHA